MSTENVALDESLNTEDNASRFFHHIEKLLNAVPLNIYEASRFTHPYPYMLNPANDCRPSVRNTCNKFIVDSGYKDDEVTNATVLDKAVKSDARYLIPKDYIGNQKKTTESVYEFLDLYEKHEAASMDMTPIIPLQPPYDEHHDELSGFTHYALGGVADKKPEQQLQRVQDFRDKVGYEPYVHGLGMGGSFLFVKAVRRNNDLLDSIDISSVSTNITHGKMLDKNLNVNKVSLPRGDKSNIVYSAFAYASLVMLNYIYSDYCEDPDTESDQATLQKW